MRRRYYLPLNLFALSLLAFSLYLNFIKKDAPEMPMASGAVPPAQAEPVAKESQKTVTAKEHTPTVIAAK